ncbi:MAG: hypothetical protein ACTHMM_17660 [Agriterribacter sp.]
MQAIDNKPARNYVKQEGNFEASVTFSLSSNNLTITDTTSYPSGDARKVVNITVFDRFGKQVEAQIGDSPNNVVVNVSTLNKTEGLDAIVTVVSNKGFHKDGSIKDIATIKQSGSFDMKY